MKLYTILAAITAVSAHAIAPIAPRDDTATPNFGYNELYELQTTFWQKFQYPNSLIEAQSINSTVFSEDVQGRVSDTRDFLGRELNTEYIFGLFGGANGFSIVGVPGAFEIVQFSAQQNIAAASTRINFTFPSFGNVTYPVRIDTWITWNAAKQITQYDVVFRWFGFLLKTLLTSGDPTVSDADKLAKLVDVTAKSICGTHQTYCNGTNTQYASSDQCYEFLTKEIRVGESFELGMNTLLCRSIHEIMIKYRPNVHCAHIGPSGGDMCDDKIGYAQKVDDPLYTNSPWIPTVYS
ncbi:hypothetical protein K491DRAFT_680450 [Lophiostoma macrostomum CBS 122681]|uniref:Uncharacterized protein n=1 Tax=Lophiostoma macrostomum CBS 122681 TaxID=1314788 RepID=A0A6A6T138_9PLEO|nr:hypothetical protein K491DRAFT_680450 [Lophiostoma macrostomum CBS 122681]